MRKLSYLSITVALLFLAVSLSAQTADPATPAVPVVPEAKPVPLSVFKSFPSAIGYTQGDLSGGGFTFRHWLGDWGFQVSGMVSYNPNHANVFSQDYLYHSTGISVLRTLFSGEPVDWFYTQLYIQGHGSITGKSPWNTEWNSVQYVNTQGEYKSFGNLGVGLGVEIGLIKHISWILEVSERVKTSLPYTDKDLDIGPQFQTSYLYRF